MELKILNDATEYLNRLERVNSVEEAVMTNEDVLFLPERCSIKVLEDSNVIVEGLGSTRDYKAKDLLRVIRVIDALKMDYEECKILVPSIYAHSLHVKPWHITTQGFLTTRFTPELGQYIVEEEQHLTNYYGKHKADCLWLPYSKKIEEMNEGDVVCIFNRRVSGWDGSIERPVIELLGAGGHLQSVWDKKQQKFITRSLVDNLSKEFDEEIGISLTEKEIQSIGGFINSKTYELVILSNIYISPEKVPEIQRYALGNYEEDTDGIYMGSFEEVMSAYKTDATFFAGGTATAQTNFPNNSKIMERFMKVLDII